MKINISITKSEITKVVEILSHYLADSFYLYLKTHNFHWNIKGIHFLSLHELFEKQYKSIFENLDSIAERIRSLGEIVPGNFFQLKELTCIKEIKEIPAEKEMIKMLLEDHELIIRNLRAWIKEINNFSDVGTSDFLTARIQEHEKNAWLLRSHFD